MQERLPGVPPERPTRLVVAQMVDLLDGFRGLLAGRADLPVPDLYLGRSGPGFSVHESLALHSVRSRRLLAWIREVGTAEPSRMAGEDLVHLDFHPGNVLVDPAGRIAGIVDWDGIGRGDRRFGLVTLRFGLSSQAADPATAAWLDGVLAERIEPDLLRLYWAAMSLREVDWAIRHHGPAEVDRALTLAESRIDH